MGVLVDDLLLLAQLDQGRPLEQERVDLVPLVTELVADARAIEPDRPLELDATARSRCAATTPGCARPWATCSPTPARIARRKPR